MPQLAAGGDAVSEALLDLFCLGEAAFGFARPDRLAIDAHFEDAGVVAPGDDGDLAELVREGGEELLGEVGGAQEPAALGAVLDFDSGRAGHLGNSNK